jgi:Saxitoxin biosynthesis operon protein SxtJ
MVCLDFDDLKLGRAGCSSPEVNDTEVMKHLFRREREFGLIIGGVFAVLGAWWLYRGKFFYAPRIALPLGITLVIAGLVWPKVLVWPNKAWMLLAEALSFVMTRVILGIVFFLIVTPIGVIKRIFGWDPLNRRSASRGSYWSPYSERQHNPRHYEKMF